MKSCCLILSVLLRNQVESKLNATELTCMLLHHQSHVADQAIGFTD